MTMFDFTVPPPRSCGTARDTRSVYLRGCFRSNRRTVADIDFERMMICPRKQADDRTRVLRELKTNRSRDHVPIAQQTATILRSNLEDGWKPNPQNLLFPNRRNRPCKRANMVKFGLHPILKKLGLPTHRAGLHAFRLGLGTALADAGVSPAVVQKTLRHTDIKTTLRFHVPCAYREFRPYQPASLWHANRRSRRCTFLVGKHIGV